MFKWLKPFSGKSDKKNLGTNLEKNLSVRFILEMFVSSRVLNMAYRERKLMNPRLKFYIDYKNLVTMPVSLAAQSVICF